MGSLDTTRKGRTSTAPHTEILTLPRPGMRICQLIFEQTLGTPEKGYQGQFAGQKSG
jgi:dCTP deaminase